MCATHFHNQLGGPLAEILQRNIRVQTKTQLCRRRHTSTRKPMPRGPQEDRSRDKTRNRWEVVRQRARHCWIGASASTLPARLWPAAPTELRYGRGLGGGGHGAGTYGLGPPPTGFRCVTQLAACLSSFPDDGITAWTLMGRHRPNQRRISSQKIHHRLQHEDHGICGRRGNHRQPEPQCGSDEN